MRILILILITFFATTPAFCEIVVSNDFENKCKLYQVINRDENGHLKTSPGQTVISDRTLYGFSFKNLEVDFKNQVVLVSIVQNIVLNLDRPLFETKSIISPKNPQFDFLINQLNRTILLFEKICLSSENIIIYANYFPN